MKWPIYRKLHTIIIIVSFVAFLNPVMLHAQNRQRPAGNRERPATEKPAGTRDQQNRQNKKQPVRTATKPGSRPENKEKVKNDAGTGTTREVKNTNVSGGDKTNVSTGNKTNVSGNTVNIDNSRDVNVNVNRNTVVVANPRPYTRPPYAYGGYRYYAYHPYAYHPYRPYYYGPAWHPWGFFITTLAATAIIVTVANQQYHYDQGVYYVASGNGYTVVQAPVGATITTLPPGTQTVVINETTNNYYYGGTYYTKSDKGYTVVPPTAGAVVENLPEGGKEVKIGDVTYVKVGDTYYQPIVQDGKNMYEVVDVKEDK